MVSVEGKENRIAEAFGQNCMIEGEDGRVGNGIGGVRFLDFYQ